MLIILKAITYYKDGCAPDPPRLHASPSSAWQPAWLEMRVEVEWDPTTDRTLADYDGPLLRLEKGELLKGYFPQKDQGWAYGETSDGRKGYFPPTYCIGVLELSAPHV